MRSSLLAFIIVATIGVALDSRTGQDADGAALYASACAQCHDRPAAGSRAPTRETLHDRSPEAIVDALTGGAMRYQGLSLSGAERRAVAEYLSGTRFGADITGAARARCAAPPPLGNQEGGPAWNGWGPTLANTHFQPAAQARLSAEQVPRLALAWAFGFPDTTSAWAQPAIVGGRLFVGSQNGTVYSLDPRTGCVIWTFTARGGVRASVSVGGGRAYFSDQKGYAYALDARGGAEIWTRKVDDHPLIRLTGSPALHGGRLYVPTSSYEEAGKPPTYACCTFRGSIVALDGNSTSGRSGTAGKDRSIRAGMRVWLSVGLWR